MVLQKGRNSPVGVNDNACASLESYSVPISSKQTCRAHIGYGVRMEQGESLNRYILQYRQRRKQMDSNDQGIQPDEEGLYSSPHHWNTC